MRKNSGRYNYILSKTEMLFGTKIKGPNKWFVLVLEEFELLIKTLTKSGSKFKALFIGEGIGNM